MQSLFNLHTHTHYCDGSDHPEEYVKAAIEAGFHTLGFSGHAPVPFKNGFAIQSEIELKNYCQSIRKIQDDYRDRISILLALEIDYIRELSQDFIDLKSGYGLDYTIGSVHLVKNGKSNGFWFIDGPKVESFDRGIQNVFNGDIKRAVTAYFDQINQMVLTQKPDIVGHLDKIKMHNQERYFKEDESWYRRLWMETLEIIRQSGLVIEVNTRGIYKGCCKNLYPGEDILSEIFKMRLPITLSADAHEPAEINGHYKHAIQTLKRIGFKELWFTGPEGWKGQAI
jgi:histidinol-phosphatase (PHP family)